MHSKVLDVQDSKIRTLFLDLTSETTLPNHEDSLITLLKTILPTSYTDSYNNLHCKIGNSNIMFVCHLDNFTSVAQKVEHVFNDDFIQTNNKTVLGADDKAGVALLIHMINHQIPGHYIFFKAEEIGCLGSLEYKKAYYKEIVNYSHCISFDRRGCSDIVYCQNNINTASVEFANYLATEFQKEKISYSAVEGGLTDSGSFKYLIPECVNLSVGYYANHSVFEKQNITFLKKLANAVLKIEWHKLPIYREIPNLREIVQFEKNVLESKNQAEIALIEKELGFSLY